MLNQRRLAKQSKFHKWYGHLTKWYHHIQKFLQRKKRPKKIPYTILEVSPLNHHKLLKILLKPKISDKIPHYAGQFIKIHIRRKRQPYSMANAPTHDGALELHIQNIPGLPFNRKLLKRIHKKKTLFLSGPYGKACYDPESPDPLILIAGGAGFAPCKAIIEESIKNKVPRPLYLFWGARRPEDLYLNELVSHWASLYEHFHYMPIIENLPTATHWQGKTGLAHQAVLDTLSDLRHFQVYAAGPYAMVFAAYKTMTQRGLPENQFHSDMLKS